MMVPVGPEMEPDALVFAFQGSRLLVRYPGFEVPEVAALGPAPPVVAGPVGVGSLGGRSCYALALEPAARVEGLVAVGLRDLFAEINEPAVVAMASRAWETVEWWFAHAYCGRCGTPTRVAGEELARVCPACGALHFPRITPAVITLVHRGQEVLLARDRRFRPGFYALLAGFVEPGETLEQAVAREVREEVGLEVEDIRYFGSQSWPFPSQLMVGFFARYRAGEIRIQEAEISDARWFSIDGLPTPENRPADFSIAGRLLAAFAEGRLADTSRHSRAGGPASAEWGALRRTRP